MAVASRFRQSFETHAVDILSKWGLVIPILLLVGALSIRQIDLYPPTVDEFFSMNDAGWLKYGPYSPEEIIASLKLDGPSHTPFYFMLLSVWGSLTSYDIATGRVLTIFIGLLSIAMAYRLAYDFVAPVAAYFALIIVVSCAFYNFYIPHLRMYPLLVLTSGVALWIYLRITHRRTTTKITDYVALGAAVFALINTHAFSALFLVMLGSYHLLFVPKNRRWLLVCVAVVVAVALFSDYAMQLIASRDRFVRERSDLIPDGATAVMTWLKVMLNNQPGLLLLSFGGLLLGILTRRIKVHPYVFMFLAHWLGFAILTPFVKAISFGGMRYQLAGWLPFVLFLATGLYGLFRFRTWLGLLALAWLAAGLSFQASANWWTYLTGRSLVFRQPPTQVISRKALQAEQRPVILAYPFDSFYSYFSLQSRGYINYSQADHFFRRHGISVFATGEFEEFEETARYNTISSPSLWVFYQQPRIDSAEINGIRALMGDLNYRLCETEAIAVDTVLEQYMWDTLNCASPQLLGSYQNELIDYHFYGALVDTDSSSVLFNDHWMKRVDDSLDSYNMSYQLLTEDWDNVAQLDLPLTNPDQLRLFTIDIADTASGTYDLVAIFYNNRTGERSKWLNNSGYWPEILKLAEVNAP